jgi:hypothetical protein
MCMSAPSQPVMAPPPPVIPAPPPPPPPAPTATATQTATPNASVAKVQSRRNPLAIQKSDSVSTGLNIPV